jgi:transcriptional regulator
MSKSNPDVLQGTLDLLILRTLARVAQHGYGIVVHVQQVSDEVLRVEEGSLYPALHRIEQAGWISSERGTSENNRRAKYYSLYGYGAQATCQLVVFARVTTNPSRLMPAIRREVHGLNNDLAVYDARSLRDRIAASTARARFGAILMATFAGIALVLAAIGIYGVMSYTVAQRTREIGIRMALGAQAANVRALVLGRGLVLTAAGITIGTAAALAATRVLATMLYQVKPDDPSTFVVMAGILGVVGLLATYIPARRATQVDPMTALRTE